MTNRNTKFVAVGAVLMVVGLVLGYGGLAPMTEDRDPDGYFLSNPLTVERSSHAVITHDVGLLRGRYETLTEESLVLHFVADPDDVRMRGVPSGPDAMFMGIGPAAAVADYLDGVAHDEITDWNADLANIVELEYAAHDGTNAPAAPTTETFWVASVSGSEALTLDWTIERGDWAVVVMNADGSSGVLVELELGALPASSLDVLSWTAFAAGLVLVIAGALLLVVGIRLRRAELAPDADSAAVSSAR